MRRFNRKLILITIFVCVLLFTGCDMVHLKTYNASKEGSGSDVTVTGTTKKNDSNKDSKDEKNNKGDKENNKTNEKDTTTISTTPTPSVKQPMVKKEFTIFSVNVETGDIEAKTASISDNEQITPQLIVDTVVESLADQSIIVGIDSVTTKDNAVIVSFKEAQAPYKNIGASYEAAILDALAQSLTDNLKDYSKVIYRVDGKAYSSDHIELGLNEVYFEDK